MRIFPSSGTVSSAAAPFVALKLPNIRSTRLCGFLIGSGVLGGSCATLGGVGAGSGFSGSSPAAYRMALCIRSDTLSGGMSKFISPNGVFTVTCMVSPPVLCMPRLFPRALSILFISSAVMRPMRRWSLLLLTVTICSQRAIDGLGAEPMNTCVGSPVFFRVVR